MATAGFLLAGGRHIDWTALLALLLGTGLVIGSACVFNNYIDRGIDAKMARTKNRALVNHKIPVSAALFYGSLLGAIGTVILAAGTNWLTVTIGLTGFVFYVGVYGYFKRRTIHGTLIGSISGAMPPLAGYTAAAGNIDQGGIILFLILTLWQMPHFYSIAMYRYKDYKAAGLPVLPVKKGMERTKRQITFYIGGFTLAAAALTVWRYEGYVYLAVSMSLCFVWFKKSLLGFKRSDNELWAREMFFFSLIVLTSMSVLIPLGSHLP